MINIKNDINKTKKYPKPKDMTNLNLNLNENIYKDITNMNDDSPSQNVECIDLNSSPS